MKKWQLSMSNSEAYYEKHIVIESETEPTNDECMAIAKQNGYKFCWVSELWYEPVLQTRHLDLDIAMEKNGKYSITMTEPEVGDHISFEYEAGSINDETYEAIIEEIRGWVSELNERRCDEAE